jgi:glycosyltransferase 2 family protein
MPGWVRRVVMAALGLATSAAALTLAFFRPVRTSAGFALEPRFDLHGWVDDLPSHALWLVPFVVLSGLLPALRAHMWGFTAPPPVPTFGVRYHALAIGALVHNTLPARLGLLVTAWFAARRVGRSLVELLASLLVAKLLEVAALAIAIGVSAPFAGAHAPDGRQLGRTSAAGFVLVAALALLLLLLALAAPRLASRLRRSGRAAGLRRFLEAVATGVRGVGSWRRLVRGLIAAHGPVASAGLAYGLALAFVGADAGLAGGWLLLGAITLGQFTPGLPVGTGVYLLACTWAARALGASEGEAAAISVLSHVATVGTNLGVGLVSALVHRRDLREFLALRRRRGGSPDAAAALDAPMEGSLPPRADSAAAGR